MADDLRERIVRAISDGMDAPCKNHDIYHTSCTYRIDIAADNVLAVLPVVPADPAVVRVIEAARAVSRCQHAAFVDSCREVCLPIGGVALVGDSVLVGALDELDAALAVLPDGLQGGCD